MTRVEASTILAELRGQSIVLPDLNLMFNGWPQHVNINQDRLRREVHGWLDRYLACSNSFPTPLLCKLPNIQFL